MKKIAVVSLVVLAFVAGVAFADLAQERQHARSIVDSTSLLAYTTDAEGVLIDHWVRIGEITSAEAARARRILTSQSGQTGVRDVCVSTLVDEFDESTLKAVAAFYRTTAGRKWAKNYEDTMQLATNAFGLSMLAGIKSAR